MAKDVADGIKYFVSISQENKDDLVKIRQWNNLKVAFDNGLIWVTGFNYEQVYSTAVRSLPFKSVYFEKDNRLFFLNSFLPERSIPALLWTPIDRAFPLTLPPANHNYFGVSEQIIIRLVESELECEAMAMITPLDLLASYISTAPAIRLTNIRWTVLDSMKALLIGKPLLPIPGKTFWQRKDMLIPTGFDLELFLIADLIQKRLSPGRINWVCMDEDNTCIHVPKESLMPLSLSSFRLTVESIP